MSRSYSIDLPEGEYLLLLRHKSFDEYYWQTGVVSKSGRGVYSHGADSDTILISVFELQKANDAALSPTFEIPFVPVWTRED